MTRLAELDPGVGRRRAACAALLSVLVLLPSAPASAGNGLRHYLPQASAAELETLRQRVLTVRDAVSEATFAGRVRGLLGAPSVGLVAPKPSNRISAGLETTALIPAQGLAVDRLASAVAQASNLVGERGGQELSAEWSNLVKSLNDRPLEPERVIEMSALSAPVLRLTDEPGQADAARAVPVGQGGQSMRAALVLAAALDDAMPVLETSAAVAGAVGHAVNGCDLLDQLPLLCVGSEADNTYTAGASLLIDLGGNDTYLNGAGSAPFANDRPVALNVDLGGDDFYVAVASDIFPGLIHGAGTGAFGGVGIVVDVAGDDRYEAVASAGETDLLIAQGAAVAGGVGLLLDLDGRDSYEAVLPPGDDDEVTVVSQGGAAGCGRCNGQDQFSPAQAGLLDLGGGDDLYRMTIGPLRQTAVGTGSGARRTVIGQGGGGSVAGSGVLMDDGGADGFAVEASWRGLMLDGFPATWPAINDIPMTTVIAQGAANAVGGPGLLLAGAGDTRYAVDVTGDGLGTQRVYAQGVGNFVSTGILDDLGGDDRYEVRATLRYDRTIVVDDTCRVDGERCASAVAAVSGTRNSPGSFTDGNMPSHVYAQGGGFYEASGLLEDGGGDDSYTVVTEARMNVVLDDRLSAPEAPPSLVVQSFDSPLLQAQATGVLGFAALVDHGGSDAYLARSVDATTAEAHSLNAVGRPRIVALGQPTVFTFAQGADSILSRVALLDLSAASAGDQFLVEVTKPTVAVGDPDGAYVDGCCWFARAHGTGGGGIFVAEGDAPTILSTQSRPVPCPAPMRRGFGVWHECGSTTTAPSQQGIDGIATGGSGYATRATGTAPELTVTDDTPGVATESAGRIAVGATLRDAAGTPVSGALVRFDLQIRNPRSPDADVQTYHDLNEVWANIFEVEAVTGPDGVARASLPVVLGGTSATAEANLTPFRVMVTYDGAAASGTSPAYYPAHAAKPLHLTP